jgi:hypothetical protein
LADDVPGVAVDQRVGRVERTKGRGVRLDRRVITTNALAGLEGIGDPGSSGSSGALSVSRIVCSRPVRRSLTVIVPHLAGLPPTLITTVSRQTRTSSVAVLGLDIRSPLDQ